MAERTERGQRENFLDKEAAGELSAASQALFETYTASMEAARKDKERARGQEDAEKDGVGEANRALENRAAELKAAMENKMALIAHSPESIDPVVMEFTVLPDGYAPKPEPKGFMKAVRATGEFFADKAKREAAQEARLDEFKRAFADTRGAQVFSEAVSAAGLSIAAAPEGEGWKIQVALPEKLPIKAAALSNGAAPVSEDRVALRVAAMQRLDKYKEGLRAEGRTEEKKRQEREAAFIKQITDSVEQRVSARFAEKDKALEQALTMLTAVQRGGGAEGGREAAH